MSEERENDERSPTPFTPFGGRHTGVRYVDDRYEDRGGFTRDRGESPIELSDRSESPAPVMPVDEVQITSSHTPTHLAEADENVQTSVSSVPYEGSVARRVYFTDDDGREMWYVPVMNDDGTEHLIDLDAITARHRQTLEQHQSTDRNRTPSPNAITSDRLPTPTPRPTDPATLVFDNEIPNVSNVRTTKRCRHFITTDVTDIISAFDFLGRVRVAVLGRVIRYITYCNEQPHLLMADDFGIVSDVWGVTHWHILVDFFEPVDASTAEEILFGDHTGFGELKIGEDGQEQLVERHIFTQPVRNFHACRFYICKKDTKVPGTRAGEIGLIKERGLSRWRTVNSSHIVPIHLVHANIGKPANKQQLYEHTAEHWKRMRNEEGWPRLTRDPSIPPIDPIRRDYGERLDDPPTTDGDTTVTVKRTYIHEEY